MADNNIFIKDTQNVKRKDNVILRKIHGSYFLMDITDKYTNDRCVLFEINSIGAFLWDNISDIISINKLIEKLQSAIIDEIDYNVLYQDVTEFIISLSDKKFVEVY